MKAVKQISMFLENKPGRLAEATKAIADAGVNVGALAVSDTTDFGVLRFICDQPDKAAHALRDAGFSVGETEVLVVQVPHKPGGLAQALAVIKPLNINIEYLYAFVGAASGFGLIVMRVEDGRSQEVAQALQSAGLTLLTPEQAYAL